MKPIWKRLSIAWVMALFAGRRGDRPAWPRRRRPTRAGPAGTRSPARTRSPGTPQSVWDSGSGDASIQGFATDTSVNVGGTISFKVQTPATRYHLDIYRIGYYQGNGARLIATVQPSAKLPQTQPSCLNDSDHRADRLRQLGGVGVVGGPVDRGVGHLHRPPGPRRRQQRRQPDPVRRAQRRQPLRHHLPGLGHHLGGLQRLGRQQPLQGLARGPRLQGQLQPAATRPGPTRPAARTTSWPRSTR